MKRKDFLKISASAAMFLGITPKTLADSSQLVEYLKPNFKNKVLDIVTGEFKAFKIPTVNDELEPRPDLAGRSPS